MNKFDEGKHPRDGDGKFADKGGLAKTQDNSKLVEAVKKYSDSPDKDLANMGLTSNAGSGIIKFNRKNSKTFKDAIMTARESILPEDRWRVDIHDEVDYSKDKLFATDAGSCVAIEPDGNIISVCKKRMSGDRGSELLRCAIQNGGDRLDAFGEKLYDFYVKNGFEPVSWTPFDEQYAPDGWVKGRDCAEPIIFYKYTGKNNGVAFKDFIINTDKSPSYDDAKKQRDGGIKK